HGQAVHALVTRGRMVLVHGGSAAGREQNGLRLNEAQAACSDVDQQNARNRPAVFARNQSERAMLLEPAEAGARDHLLHQTVDDLDSGEVTLVYGSVEGLARERLSVQRPVRIAIEEATDFVLELSHALDRLCHQNPGELLVRQPLSALDGVHEMA